MYRLSIALVFFLAPFRALADDGAIQITFDPSNDVHPTWSPDCTQIAFASNRSGNSDIWMIPVAGGAATQVTTYLYNDTVPEWSPDGSKIAFVACDGCMEPDIWVISLKDGSRTQIVEDVYDWYDTNPTWSPDGSLIAFQSDRGGPDGGWDYDIWAVVVEPLGLPYQWISGPTYDGNPAFCRSCGYSRVAFCSDRTGNREIWISGPHTQLTTHPAADDYPTWSPDGSQIAFASDRSGNWDIWVIPSTGGVATQVTFDPAFDGLPAWSPCGTRIAFTSDRGGNNDIWVIDVEPPVSADQESWGSIKGRYRK